MHFSVIFSPPQLRLHDQHENKVHTRRRLAQLGAEGEWDSCDFQEYSSGVRQLCVESIHHSKSADFLQVREIYEKFFS